MVFFCRHGIWPFADNESRVFDQIRQSQSEKVEFGNLWINKPAFVAGFFYARAQHGHPMGERNMQMVITGFPIPDSPEVQANILFGTWSVD
jgi:hypothetical protein